MQHLRLAPPVIWVRYKISVLCCSSQCLRNLTYPLFLRLYPTWMIPHSLWTTLIGRLSLSSITSSPPTSRSGHPRQQVQVVPQHHPITHLNPYLRRNLATLASSLYPNWTHQSHLAFFYLSDQVLSQKTWTICAPCFLESIAIRLHIPSFEQLANISHFQPTFYINIYSFLGQILLFHCYVLEKRSYHIYIAMPSTSLAGDIFLTNVQALPPLTVRMLDCRLWFAS